MNKKYRSERYKRNQRIYAKRKREEWRKEGKCTTCGGEKSNKGLVQCVYCAWKRVTTSRRKLNYKPTIHLVKHDYSVLER